MAIPSDISYQTIVVFFIVCLCAGLVLRRALLSLKGRKTGCGCASCPALNSKPNATLGKTSSPITTPTAHSGR